ncbi:MAG: hypothetical protein A2946_03385 [Candidatus Liptonbacteria bacterium RIFCSPLOWO2_01_FULL_53_13]|uniref:ComEC/Rec2-related protein domain-containing protein n=1 Tax=Candidatus Liptonbacteria bacterium RIFCSPLOWO2_01_FULL_53_13 TaxID=1798651 RepID=A0A1G2CK01_9BACT|nr:MAG: hypothetical protein A2946_03385 [Candidatus Liptonbacteria bacterium RIFCSPLOWO2_01_FULL_53_13]
MAPADIAFAGALSFLAGVFVAGFTASGFVIVALAVVVAVGFYFVRLHISISPYLHIFFILCLFLGFFYYHFFLNLRESRLVLPEEANTTFSGTIKNEPRIRGGATSFMFALDAPFRGEIKVFLPSSAPVLYGDRLALQGVVERAETNYEDPVSAFPEFEITSRGNGSRIKSALLGFKQSVLSNFRRFLGADSGALMSGITLGDQSGFSKELRADMAASGTTHLVALSGYNIAILVLALEALLRGRMRRRTLAIVMVIVIAAFVAMVGGEASIVRAAIMGLLVLLAKQTGRKHDMRNAITFTALIMVTLDPRILLHDLGFQLSFLCLLGIVYLSPAIAAFLRLNTEKQSFFGWRENAVMTISAQLAVMPVIIQAFGTMSLAGILANVLILEFIPATMAVGFLMGFACLIVPPLGIALAFPAEVLLRYELFVIKAFSLFQLPVTNPLGGWGIFAIYYALLVAFILNFQDKPVTKGV